MDLTGEQYDLFKADATWFHVFDNMIESGDVAKMGASAFTVYCVVKKHIGLNSKQPGAWPGIETIAEKSGLSARTVMNCLKTLETMGYVQKTDRGRKSNLYTLRERVDIKDKEGNFVADASWDYLPRGVQAAVEDLQNVLLTGNFAGAKVVKIDHLTINVLHNSTQFNIEKMMADVDKMAPGPAKDALRSLVEKANQPA